MPTGYTANIAEGQSFEDFALRCARAFGACMDQRDDPSNENPRLRQMSTYHEERLLEDEAELGALETMSRAQKLECGQELKDEAVASIQKSFNDRVALKNKYDAMLELVAQWEPPTSDHINLKDFMIEQINTSIDFDCSLRYTLEILETKTKMTPMEYYEDRVATLRASVKRHAEEMEKERIRTESANEWITKLYDSLGIKYEDK